MYTKKEKSTKEKNTIYKTYIYIYIRIFSVPSLSHTLPLFLSLSLLHTHTYNLLLCFSQTRRLSPIILKQDWWQGKKGKKSWKRHAALLHIQGDFFFIEKNAQIIPGQYMFLKKYLLYFKTFFTFRLIMIK